MDLRARILRQPALYRLWQAPFAEKKLAPVLAHNDLRQVRRVLDVGCGPGTNTHHFDHSDYLGIDMNPAYIDDACRRYQRPFLVADVTRYQVSADQRFDFILMNSLLHHVATPDVERLLAHLATLLTDDGCVHILDLILPDRVGAARALARLDRGDYPRPLGEWRRLFSQPFEPMLFEPYTVGFARIPLWEMVYFKGRRRG